jgi:hypothetical protein
LWWRPDVAGVIEEIQVRGTHLKMLTPTAFEAVARARNDMLDRR